MRRARPWWQRTGLEYLDGRLHFAGRDVANIASSIGTPCYLYDIRRIGQNLSRLSGALKQALPAHRVFYAMKANRFPPILLFLKMTGECGVDVSSPGELLLARSMGFEERDISYTGTCVSRHDLEKILSFPGIKINCDSLTMIRKLGALPGPKEIGLRIDPGIGLGYQGNPKLTYSGSVISKFGIHLQELEKARDLADKMDLTITTLHFHCGCGYLNDQLKQLESILARVKECVALFPQLELLNVGGGLGVPLTSEDNHLDLDAWARTLAKEIGGLGLEVAVEPGAYIVQDAGILVLEVTMDETKAERRLVGVNGGFNINPEPAHYQIPLEPVPSIPRQGTATRASVVGNLNEALDVWATEAILPPFKEGDLLAFLNAGAYGSSMASDHCKRGEIVEIALF